MATSALNEAKPGTVIAIHALAHDTFVPMLTNLLGIITKGEAHAEAKGLDLWSARLAPQIVSGSGFPARFRRQPDWSRMPTRSG